ncbi:tRNA pseudouridine(38-40) synthase TruA [Pseudenhygromyxa sp. WMMC2535]|uniref:tRNA pseudouridine(38-40) synthase TruA n=1 Tax=Pseudenhygromyxa sp. WMMC2535 TaxID=2712867 RepID=UPI0015563643|nr:tRNA pseudouridine(38-40) synthase TruA [Pseudenhygromyxa sp. WMMC2535]NVB40234.1 tRNA pseudouridine(38-40) synthase TruA [Pseudenhygromyxa sp. WMMC2535]
MAMLLRLAYDGTDFHGFARQDGRGGRLRTVQGELEDALSRIYKRPLLTRGASRTDAGVHARGQLVAFDPPFEIPPRGLLLGLAAQLPADLIASAAWLAEDVEGEPLNPRFHNRGKLYRYRLRCTSLRDPLSERFEWHLPRPIALEPMLAAASHFVGEHDFAGFRAADCQARTTTRRIRDVQLRARTLAEVDPLAMQAGRIDDPAVIEFDVRGDAFLKNMVRIMVGTLVAVGRGQFGAERIDEVLKAGDRSRAGTTAPARGLTLIEVLWPSSWPPAPR